MSTELWWVAVGVILLENDHKGYLKIYELLWTYAIPQQSSPLKGSTKPQRRILISSEVESDPRTASALSSEHQPEEKSRDFLCVFSTSAPHLQQKTVYIKHSTISQPFRGVLKAGATFAQSGWWSFLGCSQVARGDQHCAGASIQVTIEGWICMAICSSD